MVSTADIKKKVLSLHVIAGYYTLNKFRSLPNSQTTQLNTMLQASFQSVGFQGLLNVTNGDTVSLVSASGSEKAQLVKDIYTDDFKISVVEISSLIFPSDSPTSPPSSPSASPPCASTSSPPSSTPSSSSPFDITRTITGSPDFNLFNTYLTQTQVANQINERKTMTIFVVNNGAMTYLVDKPMEIKKKVLSLHVIMDYYTVQKFHNLPVSQPTRINTLLQVTDQPSAQQGFVNVTNGDTISIVSAAGSDQAVVVRDIAADESSYISVVQISNLILPSSLTAPTPSPSSNPGKLRSAAPVKAPNSSIAAAPKVGDTTSSSIAAAPVSNAPMTSIASGPIGAAPALHASAVSSIDCASIVTMILVSAFSLASVILILSHKKSQWEEEEVEKEGKGKTKGERGDNRLDVPTTGGALPAWNLHKFISLRKNGRYKS
ncbi:fasciclin-like arabinogalactan protein 10 [Prunus avium]|uniref:Fasciclin-like arabinogalactan protein 10 n=1 Tax=Prunus avium TaxID=42229 RepID=A0A6P5T820_PRUAV|nr:fasciclin-like arabinogalactan protein 10 [Prunus avium]